MTLIWPCLRRQAAATSSSGSGMSQGVALTSSVALLVALGNINATKSNTTCTETTNLLTMNMGQVHSFSIDIAEATPTVVATSGQSCSACCSNCWGNIRHGDVLGALNNFLQFVQVMIQSITSCLSDSCGHLIACEFVSACHTMFSCFGGFFVNIWSCFGECCGNCVDFK